MKRQRRLIFNNNAGVTITEMLAATALLSIFMMLTGSVVKDIFVLTEKNKSHLSAQTDLSFATRYLSKLFKDAGPSFNSVKGNPDDNGREFFDLLNDVSTVGWANADLTRTLTLDPSLNHFHFVFLTNNPDQTDQVFYNSIDAYAMPDPVEEMSSSSPLTYLGVNNASAISKYAPRVWTENNLLMMKVPIPLRYVAVDGSINMTSPPREHYFLGRVKGDDLTLDSFAGYSYTTHPITNLSVPNADNFLRTVPTVGGASPLIEVVAVRGYRISLQKRGSSSKYDLYSYEYRTGAFTSPFLIATDIKTVTLQRDSVGLPLVSIKVSIEKK